jgi:hypothetical protein
MSLSATEINYIANPTPQKFHADSVFVRALMGAVGTGKSVACCMEIMIRALQQRPSPIDGIRRSRWAIIRNTYPELKTTTIKTWEHLFKPAIFGKVKKDIPLNHHIQIDDVDLEIIFLSMDSPDDASKLASLEVTGIWINEAREIHKKTFTTALERVGRYPAMSDGGASWWGVICDTNPPDTDSWWYDMFEVKKPDNFCIYKYPPGLIKVNDDWQTNPEAENIENLPKDYYLNMISGKNEDEIKVQVLGQYGFVMDGKPVHPEYNDNIHFSNKELKANPELEIGFGWDFGLTPACAIVQLTPRGQLMVLDELWSEDMGISSFSKDVVINHLNQHYPFWKKKYYSAHDPAGNQRVQTDEKTCQLILAENNIKSIGAHTNAELARREALKYFLNKMVDGQPAFIISNKCKMIRKGLMGGFQYARVKSGNDDRFHDKPKKNIYSHIIEGLEYVAMNYCADSKKPPPSGKKPNKFLKGNPMGR